MTSSVSGLSVRDETKYHMYGRCTGLVLHYFAVQSYLPFDTQSTPNLEDLNYVKRFGILIERIWKREVILLQFIEQISPEHMFQNVHDHSIKHYL